MIAISGIPGSGKSGLASEMAKQINRLYKAKKPDETEPSSIAAAIPMDGYHLTRSQLSMMPDPKYAAARRGAAFTFDGEKFLQFAQTLRQKITADTPDIYAPSFDHSIKDPVENDIVVPATCRVIFFEGNYLSLDREPWRTAADLMDELWFVQVDFEVARKRLVERHLKAGLAQNEEEADTRATQNDLVNGKEIVENRLPVQEIIDSRYDVSWIHE